MFDDNSLLLQNILLEQRATRLEVSELSKTMVNKEILNDYRTEIKYLFDDVKKTLKEKSEAFDKIVPDHEKNTSFRKGIINSSKYVCGAIFVAILGLISSIIPAFFPHTSGNIPQAILTPLHIIHLNIPHVGS